MRPCGAEGLDEAMQNRAGQCKAQQDKAKQDRANAKQDKTEESRTGPVHLLGRGTTHHR